MTTQPDDKRLPDGAKRQRLPGRAQRQQQNNIRDLRSEIEALEKEPNTKTKVRKLQKEYYQLTQEYW